MIHTPSAAVAFTLRFELLQRFVAELRVSTLQYDFEGLLRLVFGEVNGHVLGRW